MTDSSSVPGVGTDRPSWEQVRQLFGDRTDLVISYAQHLSTTGVEHGLLGPREVDRLWNRHILNCLALTDVIDQRKSLVDVGSGAGLPGLVLAIARPDVRVVLCDVQERRCRWLRMVVQDLGLSTEVVSDRLERASLRDIDVITARAVAPMAQLVKICHPLMKKGAELLALKGGSVYDELERDHDELTTLGVKSAEVIPCGSAWLSEPALVVRARLG